MSNRSNIDSDNGHGLPRLELACTLAESFLARKMVRFGSPRDFGSFFFFWSTNFHGFLANFVDIIDREILRSVKYIFEIFSINLVFLIRANWNEEMDVSCFAMVEEFSY